MARNVRCHLRQESSRNTEEQDLQNSNYTRNDIWWGMLGDKKMWAKPDEHNRNEDAEMDTRKTRTYHIRYVDIREKAHTKPIHTFPMKKRLNIFRSCAVERIWWWQRCIDGSRQCWLPEYQNQDNNNNNNNIGRNGSYLTWLATS